MKATTHPALKQLVVFPTRLLLQRSRNAIHYADGQQCCGSYGERYDTLLSRRRLPQSGCEYLLLIGISHAIRDAYCFLSNNHNGVSNRDEIILVGFSRGTFTVRCLAEFVSLVGLLRRKALLFLPVSFEDWVKGNEESLNERLKDTNGEDGLFYANPKIKVLAEWDSVDTLGILISTKVDCNDVWRHKLCPNRSNTRFFLYFWARED